jgi:hypothetical protein
MTRNERIILGIFAILVGLGLIGNVRAQETPKADQAAIDAAIAGPSVYFFTGLGKTSGWSGSPVTGWKGSGGTELGAGISIPTGKWDIHGRIEMSKYGVNFNLAGVSMGSADCNNLFLGAEKRFFAEEKVQPYIVGGILNKSCSGNLASGRGNLDYDSTKFEGGAGVKANIQEIKVMQERLNFDVYAEGRYSKCDRGKISVAGVFVTNAGPDSCGRLNAGGRITW